VDKRVQEIADSLVNDPDSAPIYSSQVKGLAVAVAKRIVDLEERIDQLEVRADVLEEYDDHEFTPGGA
jgi:hypothetical protein